MAAEAHVQYVGMEHERREQAHAPHAWEKARANSVFTQVPVSLPRGSSAMTHPHEGVLAYFWSLADLDESRRVTAARDLIEHLTKLQQVHVVLL